MRQLIVHLTRKLGLVTTIAVSAIVGGVSTGIVLASIPASNGTVNTCYKNNGGSLRVIDAATTSCANSETALNISQSTASDQTALFRIKNGAVDTAALRNISDYQWHNGSDADSTEGYCIKTSFDPSMWESHDSESVFVRSYNATDGASIDNWCGSSFNSFVQASNQFDGVTILYFK
jgi:hypothetical protein